MSEKKKEELKKRKEFFAYLDKRHKQKNINIFTSLREVYEALGDELIKMYEKKLNTLKNNKSLKTKKEIVRSAEFKKILFVFLLPYSQGDYLLLLEDELILNDNIDKNQILNGKKLKQLISSFLSAE
jgi:hypothetical protein